jgi:dipeptidyl aminopeptidase/acylaminoacyl peptidase
MNRLLALAAFLLLVPQHVSAHEDSPLIPRQVLFGNPSKASPQVSPDGKQLSYLAPDKKNVLQVWVETLGKNDARQVTHDPKRGIRNYQWAYAPDTLLYLQDNDGDENFHVHAVSLEHRRDRDLTAFQGVRAQIVAVNRHFPGEILVGLNLDDPRSFDVYRINLETGAVVLDTKNPGDVVEWVADPHFRIRAASAFLPDGGSEVRVRPDDKAPWKMVVRYGPEDAESSALDFTEDGKSLWLLTSAGHDTRSLVQRSLDSGAEEIIASRPGVDVDEVLMNPLTHRPIAVAFDRLRRDWLVIDSQFQDDFRAIEDGKLGDVAFGNWDRDLSKAVLIYDSDTHPRDYYLYDRASKEKTHLFASRPELAKYQLATMKPVVIKSRDGLDLVSYLTLPPGHEPKDLPLVLDVHGGPWARDSWGFNPEAQWLANRGCAVLQVNYRGSQGFGKRFLHAGDREWAGKMHNDLVDAVQWAVHEGYADPKRVAIYGGSYGGYAALVGATFTPDLFACAVDIVGPSNLVTLLHSIPPYWAPMKKMFALRVGDVDKDPKFLQSRSPLYRADQIKIPLLIAQGANDPRVKQAESEQIVAAIKRTGKPVEYMLFPDEGHGFARPENRLKFYAAAEAFLAKYLHTDRAEPAAHAGI